MTAEAVYLFMLLVGVFFTVGSLAISGISHVIGGIGGGGDGGAEIDGADLHGIETGSVETGGLDVVDVNVSAGDATGVDFSGADSSGVDFSGADASGTMIHSAFGADATTDFGGGLGSHAGGHVGSHAGAGAHGAGAHGAGVHVAGTHGAGAHGAGAHGAGHHGAGDHGSEVHDAGIHVAGVHGTGTDAPPGADAGLIDYQDTSIQIQPGAEAGARYDLQNINKQRIAGRRGGRFSLISFLTSWLPIRPTALICFSTVTGGIGTIALRLGWTNILAHLLTVASGYGISMLIGVALPRKLRQAQNTSAAERYELIGLPAEVTSTIIEGGFGRISYSVRDNSFSSPARHIDGLRTPQGARVVICEIKGNVFYVTELNL